MADVGRRDGLSEKARAQVAENERAIASAGKTQQEIADAIERSRSALGTKSRDLLAQWLYEHVSGWRYQAPTDWLNVRVDRDLWLRRADWLLAVLDAVPDVPPTASLPDDRLAEAEAKVQRVEKHMAFRERLGSDSSPHYEIRAALSGQAGDTGPTGDESSCGIERHPSFKHDCSVADHVNRVYGAEQ